VTKISRKELRVIVESQIRLSEIAPVDALSTYGAVAGPVGALIAYLWQSGKPVDEEAVAAGLKMGSPPHILWKNLHPDVKQAVMNLARAASNLPAIANEKLKDMAIETLEAAADAITPQSTDPQKSREP
tara:strand:- start:1318 stop:1704 length:387 start_codon:yes stop_codon:yes gene_type:complete